MKKFLALPWMPLIDVLIFGWAVYLWMFRNDFCNSMFILALIIITELARIARKIDRIYYFISAKETRTFTVPNPFNF